MTRIGSNPLGAPQRRPQEPVETAEELYAPTPEEVAPEEVAPEEVAPEEVSDPPAQELPADVDTPTATVKKKKGSTKSTVADDI